MHLWVIKVFWFFVADDWSRAEIYTLKVVIMRVCVCVLAKGCCCVHYFQLFVIVPFLFAFFQIKCACFYVVVCVCVCIYFKVAELIGWMSECIICSKYTTFTCFHRRAKVSKMEIEINEKKARTHTPQSAYKFNNIRTTMTTSSTATTTKNMDLYFNYSYYNCVHERECAHTQPLAHRKFTHSFFSPPFSSSKFTNKIWAIFTN